MKMNVVHAQGLRVVGAAAAAGLLAGCAQLVASLPPPAPVPREAVTQTLKLDQNWTDAQRAWFHHVSQGTATLPADYEWFLAIEQPGRDDNERPLFRDPAYLRGWGFIDSPVGPDNPDGLPIGLARTANFVDPAEAPGAAPRNALGFTCAACHTGQFTYRGTRVVVDGGASQVDVFGVSQALGEAVADLVARPAVFDRFARRLLKDRYDAASVAALKRDVEKAERKVERMIGLTALHMPRSVPEGYGRLDALNRIGNQVFAIAPGRAKNANFAATTAPVSYPAIWSTSWFTWVQYDGSIMQPMVRNAGEALGVAAGVKLAPGPGGYASTIDVKTLHRIETQLAGEKAPPAAGGFSGLQSPRWPQDLLGRIDTARAERGRVLYREQCAHCHLPAPGDPAFLSQAYWTDATLADLSKAPKVPAERLKYLRVNVIPLDEIGTDPAQSDVLKRRTVDTTGLGVDAQVWLREKSDLDCTKDWGTKVTDGAQSPFAAALGAVVQQAIDVAYQRDGIATPAQRDAMNGGRPNCLQAGAGYRARPLNGAWSTAPYLHNGSVATLYELLSPVAERREVLWLGDLEFDPVKVGLVGRKLPNGTRIDTGKPGNRNTGHEFNGDGTLRPGVIGRLLTPQERSDIIEYLKTL